MKGLKFLTVPLLPEDMNQVRTYLDRMQAGRLDDVILMMEYNGKAFYRGSNHFETHWRSEAFDILRAFLDEAHARGMTVSVVTAPGRNVQYINSAWDVQHAGGVPGDSWLNFDIPEARAMAATIVDELLHLYPDIDRVNIDNIRYQNHEMAELFTVEGITLTVEVIANIVHGHGKPVGVNVRKRQAHCRDVAQLWWEWTEYIDYAKTMNYHNGDDYTEQLQADFADLPDVNIPVQPAISALYTTDFSLKSSARIVDEVAICLNAGFEDFAIYDQRIDDVSLVGIADLTDVTPSEPLPTDGVVSRMRARAQALREQASRLRTEATELETHAAQEDADADEWLALDQKADQLSALADDLAEGM